MTAIPSGCTKHFVSDLIHLIKCFAVVLPSEQMSLPNKQGRRTEIIEGPLGHHLGPHSGPIVVQWDPRSNSSTQMGTRVFTLSGLWPASTALAYVRLVVTWNAP